MKKRILALILALVLACSMSTVALADEYTGDVTVEVVEGGESTPIVRHVNVTWTDMEFVYAEAKTVNNWISKDHDYETESTQAGWTDSTATVTVTNHSNTAVTFTLTIIDADANDGVTITPDKTSLPLATAVDTLFENAPSGTFTLTATGTPTEEGTFNAGTVKVSC